MPLALIIIGSVLIITGFRNTQGEFGALLASDFSGSGNFFMYILGIAVLGGAGSNKTLQAPSRLLIVLVLLVLLLSNQGFFAQLSAALSGTITPATAPQTPVPTSSPGSFMAIFDAVNNTTIPNPGNIAGQAVNNVVKSAGGAASLLDSVLGAGTLFSGGL